MPGEDKIKSVLVLMMENRSFDHIFGDMPGVDGLFQPDGQFKPDVFNTMDPETNPDGDKSLYHWPSPITPLTQGVISHDFNHNFGNGMLSDLYGPSAQGIVGGAPVGAKQTWPPHNAGFLSTIAWNAHGHPPNGPTSMSYFQWGTLKALHPLAKEFVVCDNWYCDMPGQTWANRVFLHCAQTGGLIEDDGGAPMADLESIYDLLKQHGRTWKMYAKGTHCDTEYLNATVDSQRWTAASPDAPNVSYVPFSQLKDDIQNGQLPDFGFIMCWDTPQTVEGDTSMHPGHPSNPVNGGENLIASIYNLLRGSPASWDQTLFIVTFDENGGMYDHKPPPAAPSPVDPPVVGTFYDNDPPPQGPARQFDFTLLGPRVPALLISPHLAHGIDGTQYQNTSITRFAEELAETSTGAQPRSIHLTQRDQQAPSLSSAFFQFGLSSPRPDCLTQLEYYDGSPGILWPGPDLGT